MKISFATGFKQYPWIWDFLESDSTTNRWEPGITYTHQNIQFQFKNTIIRRERKLKNRDRGYAYEEIDSRILAGGTYGSVYLINYTLSKNKNGLPHISNKNRLVKFPKDEKTNYTLEKVHKEYINSILTDHLHMKEPSNGDLVMRRMPGETLGKFLSSKKLNSKEGVKLLLAITEAVQEQLVRKGLNHNDLHKNNIMVNYNKENGTFQINIIDYAFATITVPYEMAKLRVAKDLTLLLESVSAELFRDTLKTNRVIKNLSSKFLNTPLEQLCALLSVYCFEAPSKATQKPLDELACYIIEIANQNRNVAYSLILELKKALKASTADNLHPLREFVLFCRNTLINENITEPGFPGICFFDDCKKQMAFNTIFDYFTALENKANSLKFFCTKKESDLLRKIAIQLREQTLMATLLPPAEQRQALLDCSKTCKDLLSQNKTLLDIHRDMNYLLAEIAVVLCSLVVFYPIAAGINYCVNGHFMFFGETNTARGAKQLEKNFSELTL
ncbi:MAG: hypothetical protein WC627_13135 [Legionella sp.]|jgi:tRNA A-37 threonylcarbamoyl transferase component Bud32